MEVGKTARNFGSNRNGYDDFFDLDLMRAFVFEGEVTTYRIRTCALWGGVVWGGAGGLAM